MPSLDRLRVRWMQTFGVVENIRVYCITRRMKIELEARPWQSLSDSWNDWLQTRAPFGMQQAAETFAQGLGMYQLSLSELRVFDSSSYQGRQRNRGDSGLMPYMGRCKHRSCRFSICSKKARTGNQFSAQIDSNIRQHVGGVLRARGPFILLDAADIRWPHQFISSSAHESRRFFSPHSPGFFLPSCISALQSPSYSIRHARPGA